MCRPMNRTSVEIETEDGRCPASVFRPAGAGPWPAVLVYMDGIGIRPAMFELAERLANAGYVVLLPDLFYRSGPYEPPDPRTIFSVPELRAAWFRDYVSKANQASVMRDTRAFLDFLAAQPDVAPGPIGTTGYCMGGGLSLAAAGFFPERIAVAASFHGGNLATEAPESPHRLAPKIRAAVYVAGATDDPSFPEEQKQRLTAALVEAGVRSTVETYPARHGWVPRDTPVHDPACAERHWEQLLAVLGSAFDRA